MMTAISDEFGQASASATSACLISDLHLDETRPAVTAGLDEFVNSLQNVDALYILGDLFEAWIGDDDDRPLVQTISGLLSGLCERDIALYLMPGNRDFLLGRSFCERIGAHLLPDPCVHVIGGVRTLLMHGDSLCTGDVDYQSFRQMTRDPGWQADVLARPLAERRRLAVELRAMSQDANSLKADDIMDVDPGEVRDVMHRWEVSRLIHGHTHRPAVHDLTAGTRWVLGDWGSYGGWRIDIDARGPVLQAFSFQAAPAGTPL